MSAEFLRRLPLLASLSEPDLAWLAGQTEPVVVHAGQVLMTEGDPGDSLYIVVEGEFEVSKRAEQQSIPIAVRAPGDVIGEMALLDHAPRSATVRALRDGRLLRLGADAFHQLITSNPAAALAILHTVSGRLRQNQALLRQTEKMAALGTLAAGLAHELNNPAAAVWRAADQLRQALADWQRHARSLNADQIRALDEASRRLAPPASPPADLLARSDQQAALQEWLEARGVDKAWEAAPALVDAGWDSTRLAQVTAGLPDEQLPAAAGWLAAAATLETLVGEVRLGAERMSEIVKAVRAYSFLDQGPVQQVDVHEGLDNTLVILRHKFQAGIRVTRDYAPDLPRIEAHGSELNQVWTNILSNAADALQGQGEISLHTRHAAPEGQVVIRIGDTGPGIPPAIQPRIFEPFFTTKSPGSGTGLGLHIAYSIVHNHGGQIQVTSRPGETWFTVTLPVQLSRGSGAQQASATNTDDQYGRK